MNYSTRSGRIELQFLKIQIGVGWSSSAAVAAMAVPAIPEFGASVRTCVSDVSAVGVGIASLLSLVNTGRTAASA